MYYAGFIPRDDLNNKNIIFKSLERKKAFLGKHAYVHLALAFQTHPTPRQLCSFDIK